MAGPQGNAGAALTLLLLAACGHGDSDAARGGVSAADARALDEAATTVDSRDAAAASAAR